MYKIFEEIAMNGEKSLKIVGEVSNVKKINTKYGDIVQLGFCRKFDENGEGDFEWLNVTVTRNVIINKGDVVEIYAHEKTNGENTNIYADFIFHGDKLITYADSKQVENDRKTKVNSKYSYRR